MATNNINNLLIRASNTSGVTPSRLAQATDDIDNMKCHYRTERGFEGYASNRFMLIERA